MAFPELIIEYGAKGYLESVTRFELNSSVTKIAVKSNGRLSVISNSSGPLGFGDLSALQMPLRKEGNDLIIQVDDQHVVHLTGFYEANDFVLLGDDWASPVDVFLSPLPDGSVGYGLTAYEKLLTTVEGMDPSSTVFSFSNGSLTGFLGSLGAVWSIEKLVPPKDTNTASNQFSNSSVRPAAVVDEGGLQNPTGGEGFDGMEASDVSLVGGGEADAFRIESSQGQYVTVLGFNRSEGDQLDLSGVFPERQLDDVLGLNEAGERSQGTWAALLEYVDLSTSGSDMHVKLDHTGKGEFLTPSQQIVLAGVNTPDNLGGMDMQALFNQHVILI